MLETVPGWLLVWLGFDAFVKLHPSTPAALTPPAATSTRGTAPTAATPAAEC